MEFLSKKDKETWEKYTSYISKTIINIKKKELGQIKIKTKKKVNVVDDKSYIYRTNFDKFLKLMKKGKVRPDSQIDLHGHNLSDAKIKLKSYIIDAYNNEQRNVLVITGKGLNKTGLLKKEVPIWINEKEIKNLIINCTNAPRSFGGEGALIIRIKNKNKTSI